MALKLVRIALFLMALIGFVLAMQTAEHDFTLGQAMFSVGIMIIGMVSFGMSFAVEVRQK